MAFFIVTAMKTSNLTYISPMLGTAVVLPSGGAVRMCYSIGNWTVKPAQSEKWPHAIFRHCCFIKCPPPLNLFLEDEEAEVS
jgi:hypothetical protein